MLPSDQKESLKSVITNTLKLLCKNGLSFDQEFGVEALIGITIDKDDVFLVSMNEVVKKAEGNIGDQMGMFQKIRASPEESERPKRKKLKVEPSTLTDQDDDMANYGDDSMTNLGETYAQTSFVPGDEEEDDDDDDDDDNDENDNDDDDEDFAAEFQLERSPIKKEVLEEEEMHGDHSDYSQESSPFKRPSTSARTPKKKSRIRGRGTASKGKASASAEESIAESPDNTLEEVEGSEISDAGNSMMDEPEEGTSGGLQMKGKGSLIPGLRKQYSREQLQKALVAVRKGKSIYKAAVQFSVPKSTLQRHVAGKLKGGLGPQALTREEEQQLASHIVEMEKCGLPLSKSDVLLMAQHIDATRESPKYTDNKGPTSGWLARFLRRQKITLSKVVDRKCSVCEKGTTSDRTKLKISCEFCGSWFHRRCLGLEEHEHVYVCTTCSKR